MREATAHGIKLKRAVGWGGGGGGAQPPPLAPPPPFANKLLIERLLDAMFALCFLYLLNSLSCSFVLSFLSYFFKYVWLSLSLC